MTEFSVFIGTLNWENLVKSKLSIIASSTKVKISGCDWITDESISECLSNNKLEDVNVPQKAHSQHNARIASLVLLLKSGEELNHIHIHVSRRGIIKLYDGSHRLRAYEYYGNLTNIPCIVTGNVNIIKPFIIEHHKIQR